MGVDWDASIANLEIDPIVTGSPRSIRPTLLSGDAVNQIAPLLSKTSTLVPLVTPGTGIMETMPAGEIRPSVFPNWVVNQSAPSGDAVID